MQHRVRCCETNAYYLRVYIRKGIVKMDHFTFWLIWNRAVRKALGKPLRPWDEELVELKSRPEEELPSQLRYLTKE